MACKTCWDQSVAIYQFYERIKTADTKLRARLDDSKHKPLNSTIESISEKINRLPNIRIQRITSTPPVVQMPPVVVQTPPPPPPKLAVTKVKIVPGPTQPTPTLPVQQRESPSRKRKPTEDSLDLDFSPKKPRRPPPAVKLLIQNKPPQSTPPPPAPIVPVPSSMYACEFCRLRFKTFEQLKEHHTSCATCKYANSTCKDCGKVYHNRKAYYAHSLSHRTKEFSCDECGQTFISSRSLETHKIQNHEQDPLQMEATDSLESPPVVMAPKVKVESNVSVIYECSHCGEKLLSTEKMKHHLRTVHCMPEPKKLLFLKKAPTTSFSKF